MTESFLESAVPEASSARQPMDFSLFYFSKNDAEFSEDKYELYLETAKYADRAGFTAVWTPERHFHAFGGAYPNPATLSAAVAMVTKRVRLRSGSVVLPLHHPVRVAEEWAVVDNLSGGRVDLSFANGWNPNDFLLIPANYKDRTEGMFSSIETVKRLWRGETVAFENGVGEQAEVRIYPLPKQPELNVWVTTQQSAERFVQAGAIGANVLTHILLQPIDDLGQKIALYREARAQHGHDPDAGRVTVMLHTYVGETLEAVRATVKQPFTNYLRSAVELWGQKLKELEALPPKEQEEVLAVAFERYFRTSALFGTPDSCMKMVDRLQAIGVNEIACLIDFGVDLDGTLHGLEHLNLLRQRYAAAPQLAPQGL